MENISSVNEKKIEYKYKSFSIHLPSDHRLPLYQQQFPKYDRFLPHLVRYCKPKDTVIDIGANVGDTLAGMVDNNTELNYVCIEPDNFFYQFLLNNIELIKSSNINLNVQTFKSLVGKNVKTVSLTGKNGTKHSVLDEQGEINSMELDEILSTASIANVRILKSDVDGFDYDVLDSSIKFIIKHRPLIFFECQYEHQYQKDGYLQTMKVLKSLGYSKWTIFDNFGELILQTEDLQVISQMMNYIWQQNLALTARTIYYFDILVTRPEESLFIEKVLIDYV